MSNSTNSASAVDEADIIIKSHLDDQGMRCWEFSKSGWVSECDRDIATENQRKEIEEHEDFCGWIDKCPKCCGGAEYCDCEEQEKYDCEEEDKCDDCGQTMENHKKNGVIHNWCGKCGNHFESLCMGGIKNKFCGDCEEALPEGFQGKDEKGVCCIWIPKKTGEDYGHWEIIAENE